MIATVFTGNVARPTGFALACQLDKGLPPEADYMAIRRAEDEAACRMLGAEPVHLSHLEAPHRGYASPEALFAGVLPDDDAQRAVEASLAGLLAALTPDLMLVPRAVGGHVDHVVVRRAARVQRVERRAYWTDWPYADRPAPREPFADEDAGRRVLDVPVRPEDLLARRAACAAYQSQLGYQFGGPAALAARLSGIRRERFLV